jgi:hypothetical protein
MHRISNVKDLFLLMFAIKWRNIWSSNMFFYYWSLKLRFCFEFFDVNYWCSFEKYFLNVVRKTTFEFSSENKSREKCILMWNVDETFSINDLKRRDQRIDFNNHRHSHREKKNWKITFALISWFDFDHSFVWASINQSITT